MTEGRKLWYFYYADDMVDIWLDNMYGAMYDYVSGKESVRAVKYGLSKLNNYDGVYKDAGNYHTLTNDDSTLYEFFIENYMLKCGHIEHYYENYKDGAILTTNLAVESFKGEHLRSIDAFNFGKDVAVTSLQLIVLAIAISNPGTALAGGAYVVNGSVGVADGAIRIDQGDAFNGAMEMSLSFLEVGSGLKLVSETTSLGKYVNEFIRDNRGCVGARKALEGSTDTKIKPSGNYDIDAKPSGTVTKISLKADETTTRSLLRENESAEILARNGYNIEQNPKVPGTREPDYIIEGEIFDCYSPEPNTKVRGIWSNIYDKVIKKQQTERIVINLNDWIGNIDDIVKNLNDYPIENLKEVIVIKGDSVISIYP